MCASLFISYFSTQMSLYLRANMRAYYIWLRSLLLFFSQIMTKHKDSIPVLNVVQENWTKKNGFWFRFRTHTCPCSPLDISITYTHVLFTICFYLLSVHAIWFVCWAWNDCNKMNWLTESVLCLFVWFYCLTIYVLGKWMHVRLMTDVQRKWQQHQWTSGK